MSYVPIVPRPPDSPRVRELSERLAEVIQQFQDRYPMSASEIRQALRIAAARTSGSRAGVFMALAAATALLVGIGVFAYYLGQTQPDGGDVTALPAVVIGVGVVVVGVVAYLRHR
ncbi:MAG TPA: DUF3188 domain-containing protein [Gemmatimonadota bacterium]|nr:DUF3188 domain-containing protein [Gemmatimonadota bacterium]